MHFKPYKLGCLVFLLLLAACHPNRKSTPEVSGILKSDSCLSNPLNKYEIFIPSHSETQKSFPLLVAIDPHGDGKLAVTQFKNAADRYSTIVVGSSLIKNNDPNYLKELEELIDEVQSRYPVNDEVYLAGFSGGARMVLNYASRHWVKGVMACGAFASQEQLNAIKCRIMSITGMDDFNFMESAQYILNPEETPLNVSIQLTHASHAWPDKALLADAFGYFRLAEGEKHQVKAYVEGQLSRIDSLQKAGEWLQCAMISRNMGLNSDFEAIGSFKSKTAAIVNNNAYQQQRNQLLQGLQFEMKVRQTYLKAFEEKDKAWWSKEIASLNTKIEAETNEINRNTYQRIKGFLGIVCYSYCTRYLARKNISGLEKTLMVYRLVEPDNDDMKHFSDVLAEMKSD